MRLFFPADFLDFLADFFAAFAADFFGADFFAGVFGAAAAAVEPSGFFRRRRRFGGQHACATAFSAAFAAYFSTMARTVRFRAMHSGAAITRP